MSTDANLTALGISSGTLSPVFASSTLAYTVQVPNTVSTFAITPTLSYGEALVSINGEAAQSGQPSRAFDLLVGENSFSVIVTAADKRTKKTYTIEVHRISADARIGPRRYASAHPRLPHILSGHAWRDLRWRHPL